MHIARVQPQPSFQANYRFVSKQAHTNMINLVTRMNAETVYKEHGGIFTSSILNLIKIKNEAVFIDNRYKAAPVMEYPPSGYSSIEFNKVKMNIDNATGFIMNVKKPWYKSVNKIIKKAEKYIQTAIVNYDNKNIVSKHFLNMTGFTEKGLEKLSNL